MENNYLVHYGVKGQRWGVRRYQNEDGSLTSAGKKHQENLAKGSAKVKNASDAVKNKYNGLTDNQKKALKIGAAVTVSALAIYGGYKLNQSGAISNISERAKEKRQDKAERDAALKEWSQYKRNPQKFDVSEHKAMAEKYEAWERTRSAGNKYYHKASTNKVSDLVSGVLSDKIGKVAVTALAGAIAYAGNTAMSKKKDDKAASYMFPNPNKK